LAALLWQSVLGRLAGYENVNDAQRLARESRSVAMQEKESGPGAPAGGATTQQDVLGGAAQTSARRYRLHEELEALEAEERWPHWRRGRADPAALRDRRRQVLNELFYEGRAARPYWMRFFLLLSVSVIIATLGLYTDSVALVIAAMLLAPLMTPILGIAAALVMGWPGRQLRQMLLVVVATAVTFVLAYAILWLFDAPRGLAVPGQLVLRTDPDLFDLVVALTAGLAGAYMLVYRESLSALPGVAIAVALVPPLCASSMLFYLGHYQLAWEAMLIYLTNFAAIIAVASIVFLSTGLKPRLRHLSLRLKVAIGEIFAVGVAVIVAIPLLTTTIDRLHEAHEEESALAAVRSWIGTREIDVLNVDVEGDEVSVELILNLPYRALETTRASVASVIRGDLNEASLAAAISKALGHTVRLAVTMQLRFKMA
jgi:uncharacterized hydrophobic protein (TIGR00271 family)